MCNTPLRPKQLLSPKAQPPKGNEGDSRRHEGVIEDLDSILKKLDEVIFYKKKEIEKIEKLKSDGVKCSRLLKRGR